MVLFLAGLALAAILGFAAHRASVCTVRAVAEVLSTRRAYCLLSFGRCVLWVMTMTLPMIFMFPESGNSRIGYPATVSSVLGGFLFGLGAALNGGCAFSTLSRLVDGQLRMLATLGGFALGVILTLETGLSLTSDTLHRVPTGVVNLARYDVGLTLLLFGWATFELHRLWSTRPTNLSLFRLPLTRDYRLSTAAAIMGLSNAALFMIYGPWTYSGGLRQGLETLVTTHQTSLKERLYLFLAVIFGMALSTWERGSFRPDWRANAKWLMNLAGGALMGAGAVLIPGGNDSLVLYGIPILSPHAAPAYLALVLGIASAIVALRLMTGTNMKVDCAGDLCRQSH